MYFDTHAHYDDEAFDADREALLASMPDNDVALIVNNGSDRRSSEATLELARRYPFVYAAVGWHPHEADSFNDGSVELLLKWAREEKVVAIGEIGLDYHYDLSPRDVQQRVFRRQLELALELDLPVVVHDREAHGDCLDIIADYPELRGAFHCFSGSPEMAKTLTDRGWYLGFTGAVTFKNARRAIETLSAMPEDKILIETDCPYLSPVPHRGERNDSRRLPYMAAAVAQARGITTEEAAELTFKNGLRFFGIEL